MIAVEEILSEVFPYDVFEVGNSKSYRTPFRWVVVFVFQGALEIGKYIFLNTLDANLSAVDQAWSLLTFGLEADGAFKVG